MKLYFSGATAKFASQNDVTKSLGGFMSSTPIPNNRIGALFSGVSMYNLKERLPETMAFFIYNDTGSDITNLTVQQIYQNKLGEPINVCNFDWAVVQPNENFSIEKIGNKMEQPFNATWFNPETIYQNLELTINEAIDNGSNATILGSTFQINDVESIEDTVDAVIAFFKNSLNFRFEKLSENKILITNLSTTGYIGGVSLISSTQGAISNTAIFDDIVDGRTIIGDLEDGKAIGVWLRRSFNEVEKLDCEELEKSDLTTLEELEIIFTY